MKETITRKVVEEILLIFKNTDLDLHKDEKLASGNEQHVAAACNKWMRQGLALGAKKIRQRFGI